MGESPAAILVIKLSALGDFVLAMGAFKAIRRHHGGARMVLLTTAPYETLARSSGYFDDVWIDSRPKLWEVGVWRSLLRRLRDGRFGRVYDLQTSDRTGAYFRLMGRPRPEWSGVARGCSHPHRTWQRTRIHTIERLAEQLSIAGIAEVPAIDLSWASADIGRFRLPGRFALLIPGASGHRPEKRWPAARYGELARRLAARGMTPVLIGAGAETEVTAEIARACPGAVNLCGETGFEDIVVLANGAALAVGNDTGPMHLAAPTGCPCVVLYSAASNPARTAPRGASVEILRRPSLADLSCDDVLAVSRPR